MMNTPAPESSDTTLTGIPRSLAPCFQEYDLDQANEALLDLKEDRVRGSAVLRVS